MRRTSFNVILFFLWLAAAVFAAVHHELWRDEAQAWCLARDAGFFEMLNNARIEGHQPLWYLVLYPFAKSGAPAEALQFISLLSVCAGVFILVFKSKLSCFQKAAAVLSAGFTYYLPVISRNYALLPVILFSIALLYPERSRKPLLYALLIILLMNVHSYILGLGAVLAVMFIFENKKKQGLPSLLLVLNFLFLLFWYSSSAGSNYALETKAGHIIPAAELIVFISKVYLFEIVNTVKPLIKYAAVFSVLCFAPFVFSALAGFFRADKKVFLCCASGILFILCAFSIIYFNGILYQKLFIIILILIFGMLLLEGRTDRLVSYSVNTLLIISCVTSFFVLKAEFLYNFSGSKQTAEYIKTHFPEEKTIAACGNPYLYSALSAYLPEVKLYSPNAGGYISYYSYNPKIKSEPFPENMRIFVTDEHIDPLKAGLKTVFESSRINISSRTEREVFKISINTDEK